MKYFSIITSSATIVMIIMLAWFLASNEFMMQRISEQPRKIAIGVLVVYLILRLIRLYQQIKKLRAS